MAFWMKLSKSLQEILVKLQKKKNPWGSKKFYFLIFPDLRTQQEWMIFIDDWLSHLEDKVNETFDPFKNKP